MRFMPDDTETYAEVTATVTITVNKAVAGITIEDTGQSYTGSPHEVTVITSPAGLGYSVEYKDSGGNTVTAPTDVGEYAVEVTITDQNYEGSATGTMKISLEIATVDISDTNQAYDGSPKDVTVTTTPANLKYTVTYNGSADAPVNAGDYDVEVTVDDPSYEGSATGKLTVKKRQIIYAGYSVEDKTYDGDTEATVSGGKITNWAVKKIINDEPVYDDVTVTPTANFETAAAGTLKAVNITFVLSGADAGNYTAPNSAVLRASIDKRSISVSSATVDGKVYDGGTTATVTNVAFSGLVGSEVLEPRMDYTATANFANKNVGNAVAVTGTVMLSPTATASNYTLSDGSFTATASITPLEITVTPNDGQSKEYGYDDATIFYDVTPSLAPGDRFDGALSSEPGEGIDEYEITQGTLKVIDAVTEEDAGDNYIVTFTPGVLFTIEKAGPGMTLEAAPDSGAVYGEDNVTLKAAVSANGNGDAPTGTVTFKDGNNVLASDVSLEDGECTVTVTLGAGSHDLTADYSGDGNYNESSTELDDDYYVSQADGDLTITGIPASVTYGEKFTLATNGGGTGSVTYTSSNTGVATVSGNTVTIVGVGTFTIKAEKASDGNYSASECETGTVTAGKKELTVNVTVSDKPYDGLDTAAISSAALEGVVEGDNVTLTSGVPTFGSAEIGNNIPISFTNFFISGADSDKYYISAAN